MCQNKYIQTNEELLNLADELFRSGDYETFEDAKLYAIKKAAYFNSNRDNRTQHIDLSSPCQFVEGRPWGGKVRRRAYKNLEAVTGFDKPHGKNWQAAHLCTNSSSAPHACVNPEHIYWATAKENHNDIDPSGNPTGAGKTAIINKKNQTGSFHNPAQRLIAQKKGGTVGSKSQLRSGTHNTQIKTHKCPYCYKELAATYKKSHIRSCAKKAGHDEKHMLSAIPIANPQPNKTRSRIKDQLQSLSSAQEAVAS